MIIWAKQMYYDECMKKKGRRVQKTIDRGRRKLNVYCITLSTNPQSLLDVINVNDLSFSYYKKKDIYAIGLAKGYYEALDLVTAMVDEVYQQTGDVGLREYFKDRWD